MKKKLNKLSISCKIKDLCSILEELNTEYNTVKEAIEDISNS